MVWEKVVISSDYLRESVLKNTIISYKIPVNTTNTLFIINVVPRAMSMAAQTREQGLFCVRDWFIICMQLLFTFVDVISRKFVYREKAEAPN